MSHSDPRLESWCGGFGQVLDSYAEVPFAPVMLTGWSQGGMTAGELAIDDRLAGRDLSVVTGGSPVDCFRNEFAERGVRVTAFTRGNPDTVPAPAAPGVYAPGSVDWAQQEHLV